jgi:saccharopine dehydrogenase-like NADP-dependent oxidoreductase
MKALVLGCGEMGQVAVEDLYEFGGLDEIFIGTRTLDKAHALISQLGGRKTKISVVKIDPYDAATLVDLMTDFDAVINCVGPNYKYEIAIAEAAIKAKVNLVDINDDYETTFQMFDLDARAKKAGIIIVLGLGASPGINNILARAGANELDKIREIHTAWVMSAADPGGLALSYHLVYSLSGKALTYRDRKLIEVQSFVDGKELLEFPEPVGAINVYHVGHPEPVTLSRYFNDVEYVDDKASFNPPSINELIVSLGRLVRETNGPITVGARRLNAMDFAAAYLRQRCLSSKSLPKEGALRVEVRGKKGKHKMRVIYSAAGLIGQGTGVSASIGALMIMKGSVEGKGVLPPEECIDPNIFVAEIVNRGIGELKIDVRRES